MRTLVAVTLVVVTVIAGCGIFEERSGRRGERRRAARCEVDLDEWKARVRSFQRRSDRHREDFREARRALVRDLERLDSRGCRREIRREIDDLLDEVRDERF